MPYTPPTEENVEPAILIAEDSELLLRRALAKARFGQSVVFVRWMPSQSPIRRAV